MIFLAIPMLSAAQFYSLGDDPGRTRWYSIESPEYRIIYPEGLDSLARVYGSLLEKYRIPVSRSAGYVPGEMTRRKTPVILHPYNALSNGSVAWAPRRMDLITSPEASGAEAMPWEKMLAIHESRHVAQMQFGMSHAFRPFYWLFGEMAAGAMAGLYPERWMLEGDAVVAETALTDAGRGRSAGFLNYFMAAFDNGDFRNWNRWRYGSYRYYTPDRYAVGYMAISGQRYISGRPDFTGEYLRHAARRPYDIVSQWNVSKEFTGKGFRKAFQETMHIYNGIWQEEKRQRAPFMPYEPVTGPHRRYTVYSGTTVTSDGVYAIRESLGKSPALVIVDKAGKERDVASFGNTSGHLRMSADGKTLWWSEYRSDIRWSMKVNSVIRYMDCRTGRKHTFTKEGKRFNPAPSPSGEYILAINYPVEGGSEIEIFSIAGKKAISIIPAPDTLQLTEAVWAGERIFAAGISDAGYGLYSLEYTTGSDGQAFSHTGQWDTELSPQPVKISRLMPDGNGILFTSGRTGVNELYRLVPDSGELFQLTSTEYGAESFCFSPDRSMLYYAASGAEGKELRCTGTADLPVKQVSFNEIHRYRIADELSRQEQALARTKTDKGSTTDIICDDTCSTVFTAPERYRKFPHLFSIHSWAPLYVDIDNVMSMSYDYAYRSATPGAMAIIQNSLGTMSGTVGYSAHKDPYNPDSWRHSGHVRFTYSGLYPVLEASVDFNDRSAIHSGVDGYIMPDMQSLLIAMTGQESSSPYFEGRISAYIPLNFSSGGWSRGVIPQLSYAVSNDIYDTSVTYYRINEEDGSGDGTGDAGDGDGSQTQYPEPVGTSAGKRIVSQTLNGSIRAYVTRQTAHSEIYPDWGIGLEAGVSFSPGMTDWFAPAGYAYLYGYLPGITRTQGLRLSALYHTSLGSKAVFSTSVVNTLPRGLTAVGSLQEEVNRSGQSLKLTADYAVPVFLGDFSIGSAFYGKRAVITPHFDYTAFDGGGLFSAGVTACIEFGCFFWIGVPISIGLTYSYNGGPSFNALASEGILMNRHYFGPYLSFSLPD